MTLQELLQKFQENIYIENLSQNTTKTYTAILTNYLKTHLTPEQDNINDIKKYLSNIPNSNTRIIHKAVLIYLYKKVLHKKELARDIEDEITIRSQKKPVRTITHEEAQQLLKKLKKKKHQLIFKCGYIIGLRVHEISKITTDDVITKTIIGKGQKKRPLFIPEQLQTELLEYYLMHNNEKKIIFNDYKKGTIMNLLKKELGITCHTLRKSFATNMRELGYADSKIIQWMGHSNIITTIGHYYNIPKIQQEEKGLYF